MRRPSNSTLDRAESKLRGSGLMLPDFCRYTCPEWRENLASVAAHIGGDIGPALASRLSSCEVVRVTGPDHRIHQPTAEGARA